MRAAASLWLVAALSCALRCPLAVADPLCVGDCDGSGQVTIDKLLTLVNIALGNAEASACPTGIPSAAEVNVAVVLQAVNNAPSGCGPQISTPTPTPTPGPPDVSGSWREDQYALASSTCDSDFTNAVVTAVQQPPVCDYLISQDGARLTAVDCSETSVMGTVDDAGTIRLSLPQQTMTELGCTIGISTDAAIDASHSPTSAFGTFNLTFSGTCGPLSDCTIVIQSRWTKL